MNSAAESKQSVFPSLFYCCLSPTVPQVPDGERCHSNRQNDGQLVSLDVLDLRHNLGCFSLSRTDRALDGLSEVALGNPVL